MGLFDLFKRQRPEESRINKSYNSSTDTSSSEENLLIENLEHEILYDIFQTTGEKEKLEGLKKKLGYSVGMEFVKIPAGEFQMGSDVYLFANPVHKVKIPKTFFLGKYPVTQKQWIAVMGYNPSYFKGDDLPVDSVSWNDVQEFISRLNKKERTDEYCLPSEAEWEYACRARTATKYSFGNDESKLGEYAWLSDNSGGKTHPVGQKKPNPWGLYDMYGNVYEWCQDKWIDNYNSTPNDGSAWDTGNSSFRVRRGGGWYNVAGNCRSAGRGYSTPDCSDNNLGFRLLRKKQGEWNRKYEEHVLLGKQQEMEAQVGTKIGNSIGMELIKIPAGEFQMGSNEGHFTNPIHNVKIPKTFFLGKYPVTQKQWIAVMGYNPSHFKGDDSPVDSVSWKDVQEFINRLNKKEGTDKYRLPSEAEWEYACRARTTTKYSFGNDESKLGEYAWLSDNSGGKTHPVGQKKPNPWGLYDMYGNVWEFCQDEWHNDYEGAPDDGSAWEDGSNSSWVCRGGSWINGAGGSFSTDRAVDSPGDSTGFRLLRKL